MKMKSVELTDDALDWAVAVIEGYDEGWLLRHPANIPNYCGEWGKAGPIIDRHINTLERDNGQWFARSCSGFTSFGATPHIAAMRCYVGSTFGDAVEVPDELLARCR